MSYRVAIKRMLNQLVSFEAFASVSVNGDITYDTAVSIMARIEGKRRQVTSLEGERLISSASVVTLTSLSVSDKIDGRRILEVLPMVDGNGNTIAYEGLLQ